VGREYIISSNFMPPYGILLADSTIVFKDQLPFITIQRRRSYWYHLQAYLLLGITITIELFYFFAAGE
jgi:hypothetical protein